MNGPSGNDPAILPLPSAPDQPLPPWPPRPCQFGARLVQLRLKPRLVGMKFGMVATA
jgi:hypothetical protein